MKDEKWRIPIIALSLLFFVISGCCFTQYSDDVFFNVVFTLLGIAGVVLGINYLVRILLFWDEEAKRLK
jgi:ABC-type uncharacterized transport system permease subunit